MQGMFVFAFFRSLKGRRDHMSTKSNSAEFNFSKPGRFHKGGGRWCYRHKAHIKEL